MIEKIRNQAKNRMKNDLENLSHELKKIRAGQVHPDILAHVTIDYHGKPTLISQIANIVSLGSRTLSITPWESNLSAKVEQAILASDLGLNPTNLGDKLHIPMPDLSNEYRKKMTKKTRLEAEKTRIKIRNVRRDSNAEIRKTLKQRGISEDEARKAEVEIQALTNNMITKVDVMTQEKEGNLMSI